MRRGKRAIVNQDSRTAYFKVTENFDWLEGESRSTM